MQFSLEVQICIRIPFLHTAVLFGNKEYIPWFQLSRDSNFCFKVSYCIFLHPKWSTAFYKHPLQILRPRLLFMVNAKWVFSMNYYCRNIFEYVWYEVQNITNFFLSWLDLSKMNIGILLITGKGLVQQVPYIVAAIFSLYFLRVPWK